jgi:membrane protein implicated in regulation of membrane protease activity
MSFSVTIESFAKYIGKFAAFFAVYEAYAGFFHPKGVETLEAELGVYYDLVYQQNDLFGKIPPGIPVETTSDKAKVLAVFQLIAALATILMEQKIIGLCLLSGFYMVATRAHLMLQTPYVPVAMTMFGFSHVSLLTHMLGALLPSSATTPDVTVVETTEEQPEETTTKQVGSTKKKGKKKGKTN